MEKPKKDIARIREMEAHLDECTAAVGALDNALERMTAMLDGMSELFEYYGSEEWYADREGDLPEGVKAGVLSEDLVYDTISDVRDLCFRMLETATDVLKNRI